ncbi:MAG: glutamate-5-semialdehyde dehydrogenase [Candidatus Azobacteroides sp.]|nr:glutamate-5-semialdehyde dehydrogenase [Candidatus Azobacteroides sp.]
MTSTDVFKRALAASREINLLTDECINEILLAVSEEALKQTGNILSENEKDLARMDKNDPKYDRLKLTEGRIKDIATDMRSVATLPSPLGKVLRVMERPNGLKITKISVPMGVIGVIYEARPNVSFDVFSLCLKSGNACILKGGTDAYDSNLAIVNMIRSVLKKKGINPDVVTLLPAGREATADLLNAVGYVDLIIPRGSQGLIDFVRDNSKVPVIETGAGICHIYFDEYGDINKGAPIINNAKTRRVSVCNALDCLIINEKRLNDLPELCKKLADNSVKIFADAAAYRALEGSYPANLLKQATEESYGIEFLDYIMSVKTVSGLSEAISHIDKYSSKHSEAIISENQENINDFKKKVDAACVYSNASISFSDGAQFGLGAEIGISTQKLHARGPMGIEELTSYKYLIEGDGQTRV